jgi:hypothetical protein
MIFVFPLWVKQQTLCLSRIFIHCILSLLAGSVVNVSGLTIQYQSELIKQNARLLHDSIALG